MKVIDISHWQPDNVIELCHQKIDGVMIRVGHGSTLDKKFTHFYNEALKYDLEIGFYWYYDSKTASGLQDETERFLNHIMGLKCTLPVALDMEEQGNVANISQVAINCGKILEDAGYFVVVYSNKNYLKTVWDSAVKNALAFWVADWTEDASKINMGAYGCNVVMVQYSITGTGATPMNLDINIVNENLINWVSAARKKTEDKYYDINVLMDMVMNQPESLVKQYKITRRGSFINIKEGE